jgi:hypothetical protein
VQIFARFARVNAKIIKLAKHRSKWWCIAINLLDSGKSALKIGPVAMHN